MNKRLIAILLILSHITINTVWASTHGIDESNSSCGIHCVGYEGLHFHLGNESWHDDNEHQFDSQDQAQQHFEEFHEHDDSQHIHLVFELSRTMLWQPAQNSQSIKNAMATGHFFHRTVAPPVPPPTA
jgi:hypothetical protein